MATHRRLKDFINRTQGVGGRFQLQGTSALLDDPDDEYESKKKPSTPTMSTSIKFRDLLEEVSKGDPTTLNKSESGKQKEQEGEKEQSTTGLLQPESYDPTQPLLPLLPTLQSKILASHIVRNERALTPKYVHNPHLLSHIFSSAPYTRVLCKHCIPHRSCITHREAYHLDTSVSLCAHVRVYLHWRINDPVNSHCSWQLEIRDYTLGDAAMRSDHGECKVLTPRNRTRILAERVVEDFRRQGERGNVKRVEREILLLLGALERLRSEKRKKEENAWEHLEEILRAAHEMKEKEEIGKNTLQREEADVGSAKFGEFVKESATGTAKRKRSVTENEDDGGDGKKVKIETKTTTNEVVEEIVTSPTPPHTSTSSPCFSFEPQSPAPSKPTLKLSRVCWSAEVEDSEERIDASARLHSPPPFSEEDRASDSST